MIKRYILSIAVLTVIFMICALPVPASAAEVLKAPIVQYKLINHDEIALRWTEIEGADGYYVYKTDVETGKTVKCNKLVKDTTYNVTGLKASADYIFKVAAVSKNNGQLSVGEKSSGTKLTTPDEWYYYLSDGYSYDDWYDCDNYEYEGIDKEVMMRIHYNGTGAENFDTSTIVDMVDGYDTKFAYFDLSNSYFEKKYFHKNGYVYFHISDFCFNCTFVCGMKNDGSELKSYVYDKKSGIVTDHQKNNYYFDIRNVNKRSMTYIGDDCDINVEYFDHVYDMFDNYKDDPMRFEDLEFGFDSWINHYDENDDRKIYREYKCYISGSVTDNEYVYFISEPLYSVSYKTASAVYRCKPDGSGMQRIMWIPKDNSLIYGDPNNGSINLFGCDGEYLYYCLYGRKTSEKDNYYTFYRISLNEKKAVPQKLISADWFEIDEASISNGYIYVGETPSVLYKGKYDDNEKSYYRVKTDGTELEEQDEPFEWRY